MSGIVRFRQLLLLPQQKGVLFLGPQEQKIIAVTGGGTGGHVYPALPVIRKLQKQGYDIHWIGSHRGIEKNLVQNWALSYHSVSTGKLRRYFSLRNFTDIFRILLGFFQSFFLLSRLRPALLFSKGGFVSVPPVMAAFLLKIPVLTHDSDVDPGLATRINSRFARRIFVPYKESLRFFSQKYAPRLVVSGNPVREEFSNSDLTLPEDLEQKIQGRKLIVVIGGSLGAEQLNGLVEKSLETLTEEFFVIHQMGEKNYKPSDNPFYLPLPFINEELPAIFRKADLAVSRAGAGTLWELAAAGTPSLLLPLVSGSRGDQIKNAGVFASAGLSVILPDNTDRDIFIREIYGILNDEDKLKSMKSAANDFIRVPAADVILEYIHKEEKI